MHKIKTSIINTRYFDNQKQMAEFLGIKNTSKKAIKSRCKRLNFGLEFYEDYEGEYTIEL